MNASKALAGLTIIELMPYLSTFVVTMVSAESVFRFYGSNAAWITAVSVFTFMVLFWFIFFRCFRPTKINKRTD
jgi:hypothetical protein